MKIIIWAFIVVIILVILLAYVLLRVEFRQSFAVLGGDSNSSPPITHLGVALHEVRKTSSPIPLPEDVLQPKERPVQTISAYENRRTYGGSDKSPAGGKKKPWTSYKSWKALWNDEDAFGAYWDDVDHVLNNLDLDWSDVRKELADKINDNREWAGRINIVNGKPKVVELVPSPHVIGEGPLSRQSVAMVPSEVMAELEKKPALFMFHTHPGENAGSAMPSPIDIAGAMWIAYTNRFAADLMISSYGVFMYAPNVAFRRAIWDEAYDSEEGQVRLTRARLALNRRIVDILGAMEGARSWTSPWTLDKYGQMLRQYDVDYVIFPTDKYAHADQRSTFTAPQGIDHGFLLDYLEQIQELEKELESPATTAK